MVFLYLATTAGSQVAAEQVSKGWVLEIIVGTICLGVLTYLAFTGKKLWEIHGYISKINQVLDIFKLKDIHDKLTRLEVNSGVDDRAFGSKIQLTDKGWDKIKKSGIKSYVDANINQYLNEFKDIKYEVEIFEKAHKKAYQLLDTDLRKAKNALYLEGTRREVMEDMFAIYLRDVILEHRENNKNS